ncbi:hypothetical protein F0267_17355 [Vibrio coralliilyticus]|uniref:Uncharacterized protein n=1 Tax=Vibrio coralliilyticus TaxID=190893 RepID=A0AAN0SB92_9VIBR|nr:hypothetical protein [Vibrio coralliilyticus]AIW18705.1 hypothetical protein IX92_06440 [Vibrio coralliilyticus]NOH39988.1 hypothetical protein [Vibrio coralliilyticus]
MKELINSFTQATVNRLKSPFLGSFFLAWLLVNHTEILTFFYSAPEKKLLLLQSDVAFFSDSLTAPYLMKLVYPTIVAFLYTFGLPWVQHFIDERKHTFIDDKRTKAHHLRLESTYKSQANVSRAQAMTALSYWETKLHKDLDKWEQQRAELRADLANMRDQLSLSNDQLETAKNERDKLSEALISKKSEFEEIQSLKSVATDKNAHLERMLEARRKDLETLNEQLEREHTRVYSAVGIIELIQRLDDSETEILRNYLSNDGSFAEQILMNHLYDPKFVDKILRSEAFISNASKNKNLARILT